MTLDGLPVFVMHGGRLPERRRRLETELERHRVDAEWLTDVNVADLTPELAGRYYRPRRLQWWLRSRSTQRIPFRRLSPQEIALAISHVRLYERIASAELEWTLVLEDDAVLDPAFRERFDDYFSALPADADFVFIGSCCGLRIDELEPGRRFYRKDHPATKCTDSYLVRRRAAAAVRQRIVPFVLPIDWELNHHLARLDLAVYWLEPPLVRQGSEIGLHVSSVR